MVQDPAGVFIASTVPVGTFNHATPERDFVNTNFAYEIHVTVQNAGPDTSIMHWVQFKGTPKEISGYDVFVVRGGKIVFQTVTLNPTKK